MRRALLALAVALAVLVGAGAAQGATAQERADETAAWMSQVLRAEVAPRHVEIGTLGPDNAGEALGDGTVRLADWATDASPRAIYVRIHELAHRPANVACWGFVLDDGSVTPERDTEEGIADALTRDLLPAALKRFAPSRWFVSAEVGDYTPQVAGVRYAVRRLTGGRGWGRAERLKLRELWAASCERREAMLAEAGGQPAS